MYSLDHSSNQYRFWITTPFITTHHCEDKKLIFLMKYEYLTYGLAGFKFEYKLTKYKEQVFFFFFFLFALFCINYIILKIPGLPTVEPTPSYCIWKEIFLN